MGLLKTYSIANDVPEGFILEQINQEIADSGEVTNYGGVTIVEDDFKVYGDSMNESGLNTLISNHVPNPTPFIIQNTVRQNKDFADNLMQKLKEKNILEGLNSIDQSAWVHHRMRKVDYTLSDATTVVQLDVMNLVVTGDIETAEHALGQMSPDDMSEDYHWLTQDRIDWIRNEIRDYLGWPLV